MCISWPQLNNVEEVVWKKKHRHYIVKGGFVIDINRLKRLLLKTRPTLCNPMFRKIKVYYGTLVSHWYTGSVLNKNLFCTSLIVRYERKGAMSTNVSTTVWVRNWIIGHYTQDWAGRWSPRRIYKVSVTINHVQLCFCFGIFVFFPHVH